MDAVEVFDRQEIRNSSWKAELDNGGASRCAVSDAPVVIFGIGQELESSLRGNHGLGADLPHRFTGTLRSRLNGHFGSSRRDDFEDLWFTFVRVAKEKSRSYSDRWDEKWTSLTCFVRRPRAGGSGGLLICLDFPSSTRSKLCEAFRESTVCLSTWQVDALEAILALYDEASWGLRRHVRNIEVDSKVSPDFEDLHDLARLLINQKENIDSALDTLEAIQEVFEPRGSWADAQDYQERLFSLSKGLKALERRSQSLKERLQNQINLAFNLATQRDSKVMVDLGSNAKADSRNMVAIAVVGFVYLPGTFVSGLFGMNFFDFNTEDGHRTWSVSGKFWMYWAIVGPLTTVTVLAWIFGLHGQAVKRNAVMGWSERRNTITSWSMPRPSNTSSVE